MKKKLLLLFTILMLARLPAASAADESAEYNVETGSMSVSGTAETGGADLDWVTLRVFRPGMGAEGTADMSDEEKKNAILFVNQTQIGEDGSYSFIYTPESIENGNHKIYVTLPDGTVWSKYVLIMDSEQNRELLAGLNAADTAEEMYSVLLEYEYILSDIEALDEIKAAFPEEDMTELIAQLLAGEDFQNTEEVLEKAVKAAVVANINLIDDAEDFIGVLSEYGGELGIAGNKIYSELFLSIAGRIAPELAKKEYESADGFIKELFDTVIVEKLNSVKNYTSVMPVLDTDREYLDGFDFAGYDALSSVQKSAVQKAVADYGEYDSVDEIKEVFNAAVDDPPKTNVSQGQGGGGNTSSPSRGSGSASPGGGGGADIAKVTQPGKEPEKETEEIFDDLGSAEWARESILELYEKGIVSGMGNKKFEPSGLVTREQFAKMIVSACGMYNENAECSFADAEKDAWYYSYVSSAAQSGIVYGVSQELFGVGNNITREDMAVMVYRAIDCSGYDEIVSFSDNDDISDYAKDAVYALRNMGIMSGRGENLFEPKAFATRAEAAKIIHDLIGSGGAQ